MIAFPWTLEPDEAVRPKPTRTRTSDRFSHYITFEEYLYLPYFDAIARRSKVLVQGKFFRDLCWAVFVIVGSPDISACIETGDLAFNYDGSRQNRGIVIVNQLWTFDNAYTFPFVCGKCVMLMTYKMEFQCGVIYFFQLPWTSLHKLQSQLSWPWFTLSDSLIGTKAVEPYHYYS